ncbi:PAS domain-containing protein [Uliginosibacterium sp. H3]|uniref:histidine kinase n=1 Tax=Uliginosibacterium silvisoli TaxID=3114758 RepID=A0ABU6K8L4_9RHOO|nr:PAS domain-containing protein [Uliginosibacterium sp. H3]
MSVAPALTALQPAPASPSRLPARDTGIQVVAALMLIFSLSLAVAFWQNQKSVPQRLYEAAVAEHARALFDHMQDQLQLADRMLHTLDVVSSLQDVDDTTFRRLAKSLSPGFQDLQALALARVSNDGGRVRTLLFRTGDAVDASPTAGHAMTAALEQLAESAARMSNSSGRLTLAGPLTGNNIRLLAIAQASRSGATHVALIDLDKWLETVQGMHAEWVKVAIRLPNGPTLGKGQPNLAADDASNIRFDFDNISPRAQLVVTAQPAPPASPQTILGASGIALFGILMAGLVLFFGRRSSEATAAANLVGQALTASDERLQRALQLTEDGIWEYDLRRRTFYLSGQALALLGWEHDGKNATNAPRTPAAVLRMLPRQWRREVLRVAIETAGKPATRELKFPVSDAMQSARWLRLRVRGTSDAAGRSWLITGSLADISDEITHASAQDRYRALLMRILDAMPIPVAVKTADQKVVMLNERYATQLMSSLEAVYKRSAASDDAVEHRAPGHKSEDFASRMEELDQMAIATGEAQVAHEWLRTSDGEELYLRITRVLCDGLNGEPIVLGTYEDLTELQRQAQQQTALREYFEKIFDWLPSPTYIKDANHRYILTNQAHARVNKTTKEEMIGKRSADYSPDEADEVEAAERYLLSTGSEEIHEKEYFLNSGNMQRNTIIRKVRITDPAGNPVLLGTSSNVTVLREAEKDLRHQAEQQSRLRKFLQDVFDAVPHPLFVKDRQFRYVMTNRAHSESVGARMEDILGKRSADFVSEDVAHLIEESEENLFANDSSEAIEGEFLLTHRNGEKRYTLIRKALCTDADGRPVLVGVNTDITRLREAEAGLREHHGQLTELVRAQTIDLVHAKEVAERANETKSAFLANMSHELRTPLHAILSFAQLGESRIDRLDREKLLEYFNRIRVSGDRLLSMLNDLLDLAKLEAGRATLDIRPTRIENTVLESTHEFEAWVTARHLQLTTTIEPGLPRIMVDAAKIGQVLRNLLSNAIKFSPEHGRIVLTLRSCDLPHKGGHSPGVEISVADEGQGIPEAELESIFEKFVQSSLQQVVGGTGLGLAICREIVAAHSGQVFARNREGNGAEFIVRLLVDRRAPRDAQITDSEDRREQPVVHAADTDGSPHSSDHQETEQ